jgi:RNA polymerase sigma factor (sigma-70 family)
VIQAYYLSLINVAQDLIHPAMLSKIAPADLVQESILAAFAKSGQLHGKSSQQLKIWLLSVLMNKYKQQRRNIKRHGEISLDDMNPPSSSNSGSSNHSDQDPGSLQPMNSVDQKEMAAIVIQCVNQLPAKLSVVMLMRLQEGLSLVQIASRLNIEKNTAQKRYARALEQLRKMPEIENLNPFIA